jgi:hypothetical protein
MQPTTHNPPPPEPGIPDSPLLDSPPIDPLPTLAEKDLASLEFYFAENENPRAVARKANRRFTDILAWSTRPDIAAWLRAARIQRIQRQRDDALAELQHITNTSRDPIERRRAASTLLRATDPARWARARRPRAITQGAGAAPYAAPHPAAQEHAAPDPGVQHPAAPAHANPPTDDDSTNPSSAPTPSGPPVPPAPSAPSDPSDPSHAQPAQPDPPLSPPSQHPLPPPDD